MYCISSIVFYLMFQLHNFFFCLIFSCIILYLMFQKYSFLPLMVQKYFLLTNDSKVFFTPESFRCTESFLPNNEGVVDHHVQVAGYRGAAGVWHHRPTSQHVQPSVRQPDLIKKQLIILFLIRELSALLASMFSRVFVNQIWIKTTDYSVSY